MGIIQVYNEILHLNYPKALSKVEQFHSLGHFVVMQLQTAERDINIYRVCIDCIALMLVHVPVFFDDPGRVNSLLDAVVARLPSADVVMYRKLHHILLQVCKSFYSHASDFLNRIFEITVSGFTCLFGYISVDFWHSFCSFEFDLMAQNREDEAMAKNVVLVCKNYTHHACDGLAPLCFQVLDGTVGEDPEQSPEETSICVYTARLLQDLFEARPDVLGPQLFHFVADHVALGTWQGNLAALYGLWALCARVSRLELNHFFALQFDCICCLCVNANPNVSLTAWRVLKKILGRRHFVDWNSLQQVFAMMENGLDTDELIIEAILNVLNEMGSSFASHEISLCFPAFYSFFLRCIENPVISESDFIDRPFKEFGSIILKTDDSWLPAVREILGFMLGMVSNIFYDLPEAVRWTQLRRSGFMWLLGDIVNRLGQFIEPAAVEPTILFLLTVLNRPDLSDLYELGCDALCCIIEKYPEAMIDREAAVLGGLEHAMKSEEPRTMGKVAFALGIFFFKGGRGVQQFLDEPLRTLMSMLLDQTVPVKTTYFRDVVWAIARIIVTMDTIKDVKSAFAERMCELAGVPVDRDSATDLEGGAYLYEAVAFGFTAVLQTGKDDLDLRVVEKIKLLCRNVAASGIETEMVLGPIYAMIEELADRGKRKVNMAIQDRGIRKLIEIGLAKRAKYKDLGDRVQILDTKLRGL
jgi:hypothetical protein